VIFRSVDSTHLGGMHVGRSLIRMLHDGQMRKAYETKNKEDFKEAGKTRQTMNVLDVLMGLLRLGR
jgi:hypothetical protein